MVDIEDHPEELRPKLRVTLLTHSYWPESSPPQRRWSALVGEFRKQGWEIDVVTPVAHSPGGSSKAFPGTAGRTFRSQTGPHGEKIRRVPFLPHGKRHLWRLVDQCFSALWTVPVGMLTRRPDIVVVTVPSLPIMAAGYILARLRRVPLILEMRDAWPDLARDARLVRGNVKSAFEVFADFVQRRANLVVTVTEGFADVLRSRGILNVATISNGLHVTSLPALSAPPMQREVFEALYLGNHGDSQNLETSIRASAIVGSRMHLHMVGYGSRRSALQKLALELGAPVTFHPSLHGQDVLDRYASADTCIVSLRDDWKSFETTIPSKTYEVLALGRHVTAVVRGEAARVVTEAEAGDIVANHPQALADLWHGLAEDRSRLVRTGASRAWVHHHADYGILSQRYMELIRGLLSRNGRAE
ncbi:glycosyltransferase family 4 protein [Pseudarthrobacter cellobiosi]|uniref:glycosyltransferase family 4 protein n=1 Tax=Pseudarthrobacter cellobiosi TaxID=2953654 RepID=UPI00211274DF|nr:glycosyltransferase family 4 protein [Pseudarthrobacter sp. HLT3-5]